MEAAVQSKGLCGLLETINYQDEAVRSPRKILMAKDC